MIQSECMQTLSMMSSGLVVLFVRFCQECITTALRSGNKECPTCRKKLVSKRSLRPDPNFDALISKIYPCRDEYDAHQERVLARIKQSVNPLAMAQNVEDGLRQQAVNRAQRVKRQTPSQSDCAPVRGSGVASDDVSKQQRVTDDGASLADQPASSARVIEVLPMNEIELVMRPHPQLDKHDACDSLTRFIKTTSNATGNGD